MSSFLILFLLAAQVLEPAPPDNPPAVDQPTATAPADAATATEGASESSADGEAASESDASATTDADADVPVTPDPTVWDQVAGVFDSGALYYMNQGGPLMWVLLVIGIFSIGVMIERYRSLRLLQTDTAELRGEVLTMLNAGKTEEALARCDREEGPVAAILACGLRRFLVLQRLNYDPGKIEEAVVKSMDDYGVHITAALERHLPVLATVSSVAPMIGFLGTVWGMVAAFADIVLKYGQEPIVLAAANGIQVSLLTTIMGLLVGIPALVAFNYFSGVINRFVLEVEESATALIEAVTLHMALSGRGGSAGVASAAAHTAANGSTTAAAAERV
jgi:biopolymer transport protein ExbB